MQHEARLQRILRQVQPEELIAIATAESQRQSGLLPPSVDAPHVWLRLIEACCASWMPQVRRGASAAAIIDAANEIASFPDPLAVNSITPDCDLLEFGLYMHKTQFEYQYALWWVPAGRAVRMWPNGAEGRAAAQFGAHWGISLSTWLLLAIAFGMSSTQRAVRDYLTPHDLRDLGLSEQDMRAFLRGVACTTSGIAEHHRAIRRLLPPLRWPHERPHLYQRPFVQLSSGIAAPSESCLENMFGSGMLTRCKSGADTPDKGRVLDDIGHRYGRYVIGVLEQAKIGKVWEEHTLKVDDGKVCDCVVETNDAVLLIECKAITFENDWWTKPSLYKSSTLGDICKGFIQLLTTAARIDNRTYASLGISATKPRYGFVSTFGRLPCINMPVVWNECIAPRIAAEGWSDTRARGALLNRPEVLDGLNTERLIMCLEARVANMPTLVQQRQSLSSIAMFDWGKVLSDRIASSTRVEQGHWRTPVVDMMRKAGFEMPQK